MNSTSYPTERLDVVIPCFEDGPSLAEFLPVLAQELATLPVEVSYIVVDDGSIDRVAPYLQRLPVQCRITCVRLASNVGHQRALLAGMQISNGQIVLTLDADGQHPAKVARQLVELVLEGVDCVNAVRARTGSASFFKEWTSRIFYIIYRLVTGIRVARGSSDFRAVRSHVRDELIGMSSVTVFLRGAVSMSRSACLSIEYVADERIEGSSRYTVRKMMSLAAAGLALNIRRLLVLCIAVGVLSTAVSLGYPIYAVIASLTTGQPVPGWTSLMVVLGLGQFGLSVLSMLIVVMLRAKDERERWASVKKESLLISEQSEEI